MRRWTALKSESIPCFVKTHRNLTEVLTGHKLASLGDAYVNFAYSLALSNRTGRPTGA